MHHHREEAYTYSEKPLEACHIGFSQNSTLLYLMNNLCGSSVSDHIGSMDHDHHIEMIQKRARVSVNLLVVTGKMKRAFYPCSEFAAQLISVFSTTCNVPSTPPFIKQSQDHLLVYKRPNIIFQWTAHAGEGCKV